MSQTKNILCIFIATAGSSLVALPCLFSHGITDSSAQGARYAKGAKPAACGGMQVVDTNTRYLFEEQPILFDYPDASTGWTKYAKACLSTLGQENEIELLSNKYEQLANTSPEGLILMGVSRGAATAINFVAQKQPRHVRAMILEAPYDKALNIARIMFRNIPYGNALASYFLRITFPWHKQNGGIHPEYMVNTIPQSLPILLISSKEDTTVPATSVINLFKKLKSSGHTDVYLFLAEQGSHAKILWGPDGERYQEIVHAFFARYKLPHNAELAQKGQDLLETCRELDKAFQTA